MLSGGDPRPSPGRRRTRRARWIDTLAHDSPLRLRRRSGGAARELGVAPTSTPAARAGARACRPTNYLYNHIGSFAAGAEAAARSLFFGGVPRAVSPTCASRSSRAAWRGRRACSPTSSATGRSATRRPCCTTTPHALDRAQLAQLLRAVRHRPVRARADAPRLRRCTCSRSRSPTARSLDEFAAAGIPARPTCTDIFADQYFFGCEADDPLNAIAFDARLQPGRRAPQGGVRLRPRPLGRARPARRAARGLGAGRGRPAHAAGLPRLRVRQRRAPLGARATRTSSRARSSRMQFGVDQAAPEKCPLEETADRPPPTE